MMLHCLLMTAVISFPHPSTVEDLDVYTFFDFLSWSLPEVTVFVSVAFLFSYVFNSVSLSFAGIF
jgi:hypothetical protein